VRRGTASIEVDEFLPHPPAKVWAALTDREQLAAWLMPDEFEPTVGHRFTFDTGIWGTTDCEVLEVEVGELLRYSWRNGELDTEVTWRLVAEGHGTRLLVEHRGLDLDRPLQRFAHDGMTGGWRSSVLDGLATHLDATAG
jgi:uncharacterized protein YndB with AHSA1/START domain